MIRSGHGKGRGQPHVELALKDGLAVGVPAPSATPIAGNRGRFTPETARQAGRAGGLAKARRSTVARARSLGLGRFLEWVKDERIKPFVDDAEKWMVTSLEGLARDVGGGELSAEVVSIVQGAAWQKAFSAFLFDLASREPGAWVPTASPIPGKKYRLKANTDLIAAASRLADAHRQSMLAAHELAARQAQSRVKAKPQTEAQVWAALGAKSEPDDEADE